MALLAGAGGIAIIAMTSRAREREFATLRCAGATSGHLTVQALAEPALYVGTALGLSIVPITVSTLGEAWFFTRAGLPFAPAPAILQTLLVSAAAYLVLATAMLLPARRALTTPINAALDTPGGFNSSSDTPCGGAGARCSTAAEPWGRAGIPGSLRETQPMG